MKSNLLTTVSAAFLHHDLNSSGISVVLADPKFNWPSPQDDFVEFIEHHGIDRSTPILLAPVIARMASFEEPLSHEEAYFVQRTGWLHSPGSIISREDQLERLTSRLRSGEPVTLIPQTAHALPLESINDWGDGLNRLEKAIMGLLVEWQRSLLAKPIVLRLALSDGKRTVPAQHFAIEWIDASRFFAQTSRRVRNLMPLGREAAE